jgi:hypothetical protein
MAKTHGQVTDEWDGKGRFAGKVESRKVRKVKEVDFPVTVVNTRAKRIARSLWG